MITLAKACATSSAAPSFYFDRWADMATWPDWNQDTEWVRLDGEFVEGASGKLKPKGGPTVSFVVERLVPGREFIDVSHLIGGRLTFDHQVSTLDDGRTQIEVTVTLTGPLRHFWNLVLGKAISTSVQPDLDALVVVAERNSQSVS